MDQDRVFAESEGDNWFERNRAALEKFDPDTDFALRIMDLYHLNPHTVLEIGAANGVRLAALHKRYGARVVAVEPSSGAIRDGRSKFANVEFVQGMASAIPLQDVFDAVIVNFVFHWVDRVSLFRSLAEVDRLLADGGYLLIGDFHPSNSLRVHYHHLAAQEVYTYKQNYAATFLASGLYHPVGLLTGDQPSKSVAAAVGESERIGVWLLRKMLQAHYVEGSYPGGIAMRCRK